MTRLEWLSFGSEVLGHVVRIPRLDSGGSLDGVRAVLLSGFTSDEVLGPEVLRALFKARSGLDEGCGLTGWPLLPLDELAGAARASAYTSAPGDGNVACGISAQLARAIEESMAGASAMISLSSPGAEMQATPYAVVPTRSFFSSERAHRRSLELAAALGTVYAVSEVGVSPLERSAAERGIPVLRIVAGLQRVATKTQRDDLKDRMGRVLGVLAGDTGEAESLGVPVRIDEVRANEAGFLHLRAQLDGEVDGGSAIAATWAFEPDFVEEMFLPGGRILELRRKGRVEVGELVARSAKPI